MVLKITKYKNFITHKKICNRIFCCQVKNELRKLENDCLEYLREDGILLAFLRVSTGFLEIAFMFLKLEVFSFFFV